MDFSETVEPLVRRVVREWAARLHGEPALGPEDLAQELRLRAWELWCSQGRLPDEWEVRDWAWQVLRQHGFSGPTRGNLAAPDPRAEVDVEDLAGFGLGSPTEYEALRAEFWERMSPALRAQCEELAAARSWAELAELWGFPDARACQRYVQGPLRVRMEREGALDLLRALVLKHG